MGARRIKLLTGLGEAGKDIIASPSLPTIKPQTALMISQAEFEIFVEVGVFR